MVDALTLLRGAWVLSPVGERVPIDALSHAELVGLNDAIGALRRGIDAVHARVAAEIARQSRPETGAEGLAKKNGYRSAAVLIAATTGTTVGDASRLVAVGEATTPRRQFSGADAPARHPHIAAALDAGRISLAAASAIITMLDRVAFRVDPARADDVERVLADQAAGLGLDHLGKVIARAEAHLDPDGLEPREHELRGERSVVMFERAGMVHLNAKLDPESAAPVKAAIEAIVTTEFRNEGCGTMSVHAGSGVADPADADAPKRTLAQRQADALVQLAAHVHGCETDSPSPAPR